MKFRNDDYPRSNKGTAPLSTIGKELTDTVESEHPKHLAAVAEEQIMAMHHHSDGSQVELHEVGSREFMQQSIRSSLEGKIGASDIGNWQQHDLFTEKGQSKNLDAAKIEYEKKSSQNQPMQSYGTQQSVTGAGMQHRQETAMVGCNCGAEWTVTGQRTKAQGAEGGPGGIKIEQYGSAAGKGAAGYNVSSGAGGERVRYAASGPQQKDYKG